MDYSMYMGMEYGIYMVHIGTQIEYTKHTVYRTKYTRVNDVISAVI